MLCALGPLLGCLNARLRRLRAAHLPLSDARVRLTAEAARGARGLKSLGADLPFLERILQGARKKLLEPPRISLESQTNLTPPSPSLGQAARAAEQRYVRAEVSTTAASISVAIVLPVAAAAVAFAAACVPGNRPLGAPAGFATLALFGVMRFPLMGLGEAAAGAAQVSVSVRRLGDLLSADEVVAPLSADLPPQAGGPPGGAEGDDPPSGLSADSASFWWPAPRPPASASSSSASCSSSSAAAAGAPPPQFALSVPHLSVRPGELVALIGAVGSGKSTVRALRLGFRFLS